MMLRVLIKLILALLSTVTATLPASAEFIPLIPSNKTIVAYVVDGDTIAVQMKGELEKIRLIGIDTPESRRNKRATRQAERSERDIKTIMEFGQRAKQALQTLLPKGTELKVEYDIEKRDRYGRLLAYVYLKNNIMVNEEMIAQGYAQLLTYPPNIKHTERFTRALRRSQKEGRGLWASGGFKN